MKVETSGDGFYEFLQKYINLIFGLLILTTFIAPIVLTQSSFIDFTNTGQIGDTIGGLTAPFLNLLGAILIYSTFKEQIKANAQTKKELAQREDAEKERLNKIKKLIIWDLKNRIKIHGIAIIQEIEEFIPLHRADKPNLTIDHVDFNRDIFFANQITDYFLIFNKNSEDLGEILNIYNRVNFILENSPIRVYKKYQVERHETGKLMFSNREDQIKYLESIKNRNIKNLEALSRNIRQLIIQIDNLIAKYE